MKIGGVNPAMARKIELQKLAQQETIKQQQIKAIRDRQKEIEKIRSTSPDKGNIIDEMV
jgi:hypothetical protein